MESPGGESRRRNRRNGILTPGVADHAGRAAFPRIGTGIFNTLSQGGGAMSRLPGSSSLRPAMRSGSEPDVVKPGSDTRPARALGYSWNFPAAFA
jgi:hypothetical protein